MQKTVVAIGKFDGVHIAHRELLQTAVDIAKKNNYKSVGIVICSDSLPMLLSPEDREREMLSLGIDMCHMQSLDAEFMSMSAEEFIDEILIGTFGCAHVVVGYNFRFGKDRYADASLLNSLCAKRGVECTIISRITCTLKSVTVDASSSNIRLCLFEGDVESASRLLGRRYSLKGEVMHGKKIGRTIGIPTANIKVSDGIILPKTGVYATIARIDGREYPSITNIGKNPTVSSEERVNIETNIFDFKDDIYSKEISIEFTERIRDEKKYADLTELKKQINADIEFVRKRHI